MKTLYWVIGIVIIVTVVAYLYSSKGTSMDQANSGGLRGDSPVEVIPVEHASAVLRWQDGGDDTIIYTDPVGAEKFAGQPSADIILVTDIHQDHLSPDTLNAVIGEAALIVPISVKDQLPENLASRAIVLQNGDSLSEKDISISAIPMYNLPESPDSRHPKGRGNGYVLEHDGFRVYVAGDTAGIPEMRALTDIDIALVPMNLPFTMSVDEAADAVLAFAPRAVYPYHYRGQNGLSDANRFKELVNAGNPDINVVLANWYP